jgi:hypothetical protein
MNARIGIKYHIKHATINGVNYELSSGLELEEIQILKVKLNSSN